MDITYYPTASKRRLSPEPIATTFSVPEGSNLPAVIEELKNHQKPFAVHIWINGRRVGVPNNETRMMTVDEGQRVVLIQDLSGEAFKWGSWLVNTQGDESEESA